MDITGFEKSQLLINVREEVVDDRKIKKDDLSKYINMKIKELNITFGITLTKKVIAEKLSISYELFRKIINREKPTKKRDCIIAVCALLGLDTEDANEALRFNNMLKLDDRNGRDELIMTILDNHRRHYIDNDTDELDYDPDIISEINQVLSDNDYPQLDIINHRKKPIDNDEKEKEKKYPYKLIRSKHMEYSDDRYHSYLRHETLFKENSDAFQNDVTIINQNTVIACMEFDNNGEKINIYIKVSGNYRMKKELCYLKKGRGWQTEFKVYKRIEDSREFRSSFEELREYAYNELKKSDAVLNDTKNFIYRVCAVVREGDLHFYIEIFNFDSPKFNEYYLLDYCNGKYDMTVSNTSRLMRVFLPAEVYKNKYGNAPDKIIAEYDHENEEFRELSNSESVSELQKDYLDFWRKKYYEMLKDQARSYLCNIRKNNCLGSMFDLHLDDCENSFRAKVLERNNDHFRYYEEIKYNLISYFHAEDAFKCIWGPNERVIEYHKKYLEQVNSAPDVDDDFDFETAYSELEHTYELFYRCRYELENKYGFFYLNLKDDIKEEYKMMKEFVINKNITDIEEKIDSEYNKIKKYLDLGFKYYFYVSFAAVKLGLKHGKPMEVLDFAMAEYGEKAFEKIIGVKNPEPVFTLSDGRQVKLTVNDLLDGVKLGITTIEEIGRVKLKHGTLELSRLL